MGMCDNIKEKYTGETCIPREKLNIINNQIERSLCKIIKNKGEKKERESGTGFFCKIPFPDSFHLLAVLITNNHVLDENDIKPNKYIEFQLGDSENIHKILIDKGRRTYTNHKNLDTTIIQIIENDGLDMESFLEIYSFNKYENIEKILENKETYIIHYPLGGKSHISFGSIKSIDEKNYDIIHNNSTEVGSSGGPILDLNNYKILGIHKSFSKIGNYNLGTLIKGPIEEFYIQQKNHHINKINYIQKKNIVDYKLPKLSGILNLFIINWLAKNININEIKNSKLRKIIDEVKNTNSSINEFHNIRLKSNIFSYSKYLNSIINEEETNQMIELLGQDKKKEIIILWEKLSKFNKYNDIFEIDFLEALEKSFFEYSPIEISINMEANLNKFEYEKSKCSNCITKSLFHGTRKDIVSKILKEGFLYCKRGFSGIGVYFTDMIDYLTFYCGGRYFGDRRKNWGKILPLNQNFSSVGSIIYYDENKKKEIYNHSNYIELNHFPIYEELKQFYPKKIVEKNGIFHSQIDMKEMRILTENEIKQYEISGVISGNDYLITEMAQILPLYGLTLRRNEFLVVWRDSNYGIKKEYTDYLEEARFRINYIFKFNVYIERTSEKALEIIKRKKFNKIILITDFGRNLNGKKFVNSARDILGFQVFALFISENIKDIEWINNFPNALYSNEKYFYEEYIKNYNYLGLYTLKQKVEQKYKLKLNFNEDFLSYESLKNIENYENLNNKIFFNFRKIMEKAINEDNSEEKKKERERIKESVKIIKMKNFS